MKNASSNNRRIRPRNNNNSGKRHSGGHGRNSSFESNGPDVKVRGTAQQILDKYQALARDAISAGEHINAEAYYQYAEHYYRLVHSEGGPSQNNPNQRNRNERYNREQAPETRTQPEGTEAPVNVSGVVEKPVLDLAVEQPVLDLAAEQQPVIEEANAKRPRQFRIKTPKVDPATAEQPEIVAVSEDAPAPKPKPRPRSRTRRAKEATEVDKKVLEDEAPIIS